MQRNGTSLSTARRVTRVIVWVTFALVVLLRFVVFKDETGMRERFGRRWEEPGPRFRYPPTFLQEPVATVPPDLPRLHIEIAPTDEDILRGYFWNGRRGQQVRERPEVRVTVREGDTIYTNVALHLKGAAGSFRPYDDKPALTLNFGKYAKDQEFHGYTKLYFNNSVQDPTFLCEALSRELYDRAGVPVPQAEFATILINGRDLGLYVMVEGFNKKFLRRYFNDVSGNLYDGGFCQEVHRDLDVNSGDQPEDRSDIDRLLRAAMEPDPARRWQQLTEILDTDRFITMLAMDVILCHWDGYGLNRNNYRLYHNRDAGRMIFIPHGMDQMFDYPPGRRFPVEGSIQPNMRGQIARAVLATPEGGRRYFERMAELHSSIFRQEAVLARVEQLGQRLRPTLHAYSPQLAAWHQEAVDSLSHRISSRIRSVGEQLQNPGDVLSFDESGTARLPNWSERHPAGSPFFQMDEVAQDGRRLLQIQALNRGGTGSWRTRVMLSRGTYRLQGRARVSEDALGSRVTLRISGSLPSSGPVATDSNWIPLSYSFEVDSFMAEIVLVCEFSGARGQAWFDLDSLRLARE